MIKNTFLLIFLLIFSQSCVSKKTVIQNAIEETESISSINKVEVDLTEAFDNTVFLLYSYECGFSLAATAHFNAIKKQIEREAEEVQFIALTETYYEDSLEKYPFISEILSEELAWEIFPKHNLLFDSMLYRKIVPQFQYYKNGKLKFKQIGSNEDKVNKFAKKVIKANR